MRKARFILPLVLLIAGLVVFVPRVAAPHLPFPHEHIPYVVCPPIRVDGTIEIGEYPGSHTDPTTGITVYWAHDGTYLYVGLVSPGTGWVGIGFGPSNTGMDGANMVMGYVDQQQVLVLSDHVGVGHGHFDDKTREGTNDILLSAGTESAGQTVIEFIFPLDSGDPNDHSFVAGGTYGVFFAYHESADDQSTFHTAFSQTLSVFVETGVELVPMDTTLVLSLPENPDEGEPFLVTAIVKNEDGNSVRDGAVFFFLDTRFGPLRMGFAMTDAEGTASLEYQLPLSGEYHLQAFYYGGATETRVLGESNSTATLFVEERAGPETSPTLVEQLAASTPLLVAAAILLVFGTYGFVAYQVLKIRTEEDE